MNIPKALRCCSFVFNFEIDVCIVIINLLMSDSDVMRFVEVIIAVMGGDDGRIVSKFDVVRE